MLVSEEILQNADELINDAEILAKNKSYGRGISLLINSIEELMKASILIFDANGYQFRSVKGAKKLFNNHSLRYPLAFVLFLLVLFIDDFKSLLLKVKSKPTIILNFPNNKERYYPIFKKYIHYKIDQISNEITWFFNAEYLRLEGIYVDYSGEIKSPLKLSVKDYDEVLYRVEKIRAFVSELNNTLIFQNNYPINKSKSIQDQLKSENVYEKLGFIISKYKSLDSKQIESLRQFCVDFKKDINEKLSDSLKI
ncbi:MAG: AbiV family abortive infection protein [Flavobacteriales bacterium]|nr:AbiV family abortive infection protein [Flavobacteriales bacterium]MCB9364107.1 AbiV family abortive infection protein [Flavobacteriales bacterium]